MRTCTYERNFRRIISFFLIIDSLLSLIYLNLQKICNTVSLVALNTPEIWKKLLKPELTRLRGEVLFDQDVATTTLEALNDFSIKFSVSMTSRFNFTLYSQEFS